MGWGSAQWPGLSIPGPLSSACWLRAPPHPGEPASFFLMPRVSSQLFFMYGLCLFDFLTVAPSRPLGTPGMRNRLRHPNLRVLRHLEGTRNSVSHFCVLAAFSHSAHVAYIIIRKPNKHYRFNLWDRYINVGGGVSLGYSRPCTPKSCRVLPRAPRATVGPTVDVKPETLTPLVRAWVGWVGAGSRVPPHLSETKAAS